MRYNKLSVCAGSDQKLRIVEVRLGLHGLRGELRLSGWLKINISKKHIIAFKESGEVVGLGDFEEGCYTKHLFTDEII